MAILKKKIEDIINSKSSKENRNWIKKTKCRCAYECANSTNALFNLNMAPKLAKTLISDLIQDLEK